MEIYGNILQKVASYEEKRGIKYAKTDGKLYKVLKIIFIVAFAYVEMMNLFFVIGSVSSSTYYDYLKNSAFNVLFLSVMLIFSIATLYFKKYLLANVFFWLFNAVPSMGLAFEFGRLLEDAVGFKVSFYWRHLIPICLMVGLSFWMAFIAIRANLKVKKTYKKIVENTYNANRLSEDNENLSEEEWNEILKNI